MRGPTSPARATSSSSWTGGAPGAAGRTGGESWARRGSAWLMWRIRLELSGQQTAYCSLPSLTPADLRYVLEKFSFISKRRVGVLGAQYGGWLAAMILANSGALQCGVFTDPIMEVDRLGRFNKHLPVSLENI